VLAVLAVTSVQNPASPGQHPASQVEDRQRAAQPKHRPAGTQRRRGVEQEGRERGQNACGVGGWRNVCIDLDSLCANPTAELAARSSLFLTPWALTRHTSQPAASPEAMKMTAVRLEPDTSSTWQAHAHTHRHRHHTACQAQRHTLAAMAWVPHSWAQAAVTDAAQAHVVSSESGLGQP
jgi:hypothetical protein